MPQDTPPAKQFPRDFLALVAVVVVGVAASLWLSSYARNRIAHDTAEALERQIQSRHALIRETLDSYQECLFSLGLVLSVDEAVTRDEFRRASDALLKRHPGVLGLQWAPLVPAAERAAWEKRAAAEFGSPLPIVQRGRNGSDIPVPARPEYFPII